MGGKADYVGPDVSGLVDVGRRMWNFFAYICATRSLTELENWGGGVGR